MLQDELCVLDLGLPCFVVYLCVNEFVLALSIDLMSLVSTHSMLFLILSTRYTGHAGRDNGGANDWGRLPIFVKSS